LGCHLFSPFTSVLLLNVRGRYWYQWIKWNDCEIWQVNTRISKFVQDFDLLRW
jgi:hypothetical protein